jgi:uncharacterized protein YndB with AHSA1/START domain
MASEGSGFAIERSISIIAPPAAVFGLINDLRHWERWNPNGRHDPAIERIYGGAQSGTGATLAWRGRRSGSGHMEITSSVVPTELVVVVDFERPFKVRNLNRFELRPDGSGTMVIWSMQGPKPLLVKIIGLVFNVDKAVATHFEDGLATLKAVAEAL